MAELLDVVEKQIHGAAGIKIVKVHMHTAIVYNVAGLPNSP